MSNGFNGEIGKTVLHEARKPLPEELERDFIVVGNECQSKAALSRIRRVLEEALESSQYWQDQANRALSLLDESLNSGDGVYTMNNRETAAWIRDYFTKPQSHWSWPTDGCGYDQHIRFVNHRNKNYQGNTKEEFKAFALAYADALEAK